MKNEGKASIIFIVISAILLISLTGVSLFFFEKEFERRKSAEVLVDQSKSLEVLLQKELKNAKHQISLLEDKISDADKKIDDLSNELDLEKGLKDKIKNESQSLQTNLDVELKNKTDLQGQLKIAQDQIAELQGKLEKQALQVKSKESDLRQMGEVNEQLKKQIEQLQAQQKADIEEQKTDKPAVESKAKEFDLEKIVVNPDDNKEGRVLNIDNETEFLVFNLGSNHGINNGDVMSVYRGSEYLGDVKVTRVQPKISAADFIPPFASSLARKNDQVVRKQ